MTTATSNKTRPIEVHNYSNESGFDFPLSPSEPGKFDFYRVHLNNQSHKHDSMFADNYDTPTSSTEPAKRWTPFANMKHLSESVRSSSASALPTKSSADADGSALTKQVLNKPIQQVASFSSLTDAVKNAMQRGNLNPTGGQIRRQGSGTTLSSKDLNHLSPQSM